MLALYALWRVSSAIINDQGSYQRPSSRPKRSYTHHRNRGYLIESSVLSVAVVICLVIAHGVYIRIKSSSDDGDTGSS